LNLECRPKTVEDEEENEDEDELPDAVLFTEISLKVPSLPATLSV
jgi:hypothetical protein